MAKLLIQYQATNDNIIIEVDDIQTHSALQEKLKQQGKQIIAPFNKSTVDILRDFVNADPRRVVAVSPHSPHANTLKAFLETAKIIKTERPKILESAAAAVPQPSTNVGSSANYSFRFLGSVVKIAQGLVKTVANCSGISAAATAEDEESMFIKKTQ